LRQRAAGDHLHTDGGDVALGEVVDQCRFVERIEEADVQCARLDLIQIFGGWLALYKGAVSRAMIFAAALCAVILSFGFAFTFLSLTALNPSNEFFMPCPLLIPIIR
jgi:hypothetical protein